MCLSGRGKVRSEQEGEKKNGRAEERKRENTLFLFYSVIIHSPSSPSYENMFICITCVYKIALFPSTIAQRSLVVPTRTVTAPQLLPTAAMRVMTAL